MIDFRIETFEKVFGDNIDEIDHDSLNFPQLSENQNLRAQQLIKHTKDNRERIENSIRTYSQNW